MGIWGARPKGRESASEQSSTLPAERLSQLMIFVERAAAPAPTFVVPDLPPLLVSPPRHVEVVARPSLPASQSPMAAVEPVPATPAPAPAPVTSTVDPGAANALPDPILAEPAAVAGKRRRLLPRRA